MNIIEYENIIRHIVNNGNIEREILFRYFKCKMMSLKKKKNLYSFISEFLT